MLEAAQRIHGMKPSAAQVGAAGDMRKALGDIILDGGNQDFIHLQSCIAMLSYPGGLYLDVKSAYSKAQELKWFSSTLAGIGVNVKVGWSSGEDDIS